MTPKQEQQDLFGTREPRSSADARLPRAPKKRDTQNPEGVICNDEAGNKRYANLDGLEIDPELLDCVLRWRMPYGRFETWPLLDLPEPYVVWMYRNAMPQGKLGQVFGLLYEIKANGIEAILRELQNLPPAPPDAPGGDK